VDRIGVAYGAAIAVVPDGTPYLAYSGRATSGPVLQLSSYSAGQWTPRVVAMNTLPISYLDLALAGTTPQLAWHDPDGHAMRFVSGAGPTFNPETVAENIQALDSQRSLSIAVDPMGRPHVAFHNGNGFNVGQPIVHAQRGSSGWTTEDVAPTTGSGDVRIAIASSGLVAIGFAHDRGLTVAESGARGWALQTIVPQCQSGPFDMAFDSTGKLAVAHACSNSLVYLSDATAYPAGYADACAQLATDICNRGCTCAGDGRQCCFVSSSTGDCGPLSDCIADVFRYVCGNATQSSTATDACRMDLPGGTCSNRTTPAGFRVATSCDPLFH
jgi:hypothetical protein